MKTGVKVKIRITATHYRVLNDRRNCVRYLGAARNLGQ